MTEEKVKNRGWVKNAAIIFLAVMLVLTFFSNTIMNRSLPEVSAQYAQSGAITTRVRGTGKIEAAETYEVKSGSSRKVKSVAVKVGDPVEPGTLLFVLAEGDGDELTTAKNALEEAQYAYQKALIQAGGTDANGENRAIQRAREKLEAAIAERDANKVSKEDVSIAKTELDTATAAFNTAQDKLTAAGGDTAGGGSGGGSYAPVQAAEAALKAAKTTYDAAMIKYKTNYDAFKAYAAWAAKDSGYTVEAYMEFLAEEFKAAGKDEVQAINGADFNKNALALAYTTVTTANKAYTSAQTTYNEALNAYYNSMSPDNSALMKKRDEAKRVMTKAQERYDTVKAQKTAYEAAKDAVVTCQDTLEQAITSQKLQGLDMQKLRQDIADKQTLVNKLSGSSGAGGEIKSEIFGVIKSIGVTAGNSTTADTVMAAIEVPDRGYITTISVTSEQAKRVTVGDSAEVTSGYWGGPAIEATLSNIKPDPQNPQANKLLIFSLKGEDIQSGSQVSVSIGQKSQNYDVIVPSSAVREDSNGSFVLVVMAKSSPLGNRYVATRVDVQVLAKDDTNSAVSGGVAAWDYVVTNSTKPIESGMQVRMTDAG